MWFSKMVISCPHRSRVLRTITGLGVEGYHVRRGTKKQCFQPAVQLNRIESFSGNLLRG